MPTDPVSAPVPVDDVPEPVPVGAPDGRDPRPTPEARGVAAADRAPRSLASVVIAVLVALMVAVLATRDPEHRARDPEPADRRARARPSAATTLDGEEVSIDDYRGRWVVLNFFASWCVPCLEEHPELLPSTPPTAPRATPCSSGVTFDDKADDARAFFEEHGGDWPVIDDPENSIGVAYGVAQVPETFVIPPNGTVVQRFAGAVTQAELDELIASYEESAS